MFVMIDLYLLYSLDFTFFLPLLGIFRFQSQYHVMALKWPIMCWCVVKKLLTHSLTDIARLPAKRRLTVQLDSLLVHEPCTCEHTTTGMLWTCRQHKWWSLQTEREGCRRWRIRPCRRHRSAKEVGVRQTAVNTKQSKTEHSILRSNTDNSCY